MNSNLNPSELDFTTPYESTNGIPMELMPWITACFILFILYVVFRVRKSLKEEKKK